jgi:hypothetical protein
MILIVHMCLPVQDLESSVQLMREGLACLEQLASAEINQAPAVKPPWKP